MKMLIVFILLVHGLIHIMGFVKSVNPNAITELKTNISKPLGILWLLTAFLFIFTSAFLFVDLPLWWIPVSIGVIISQVLIVLSWQDSKFGTMPNLIIIFFTIIININL